MGVYKLILHLCMRYEVECCLSKQIQQQKSHTEMIRISLCRYTPGILHICATYPV